MSDVVRINFPPGQKLPPGYRIEWWASDEHYHWVIHYESYSEVFSDRFDARQAAWNHYHNL